jgi:hypothetical protein
MKGLGDVTAPTILAAVGTPQRFKSHAAFWGWTGIVPHASQSADSDAKGLTMTKASPQRVKLAFYLKARSILPLPSRGPDGSNGDDRLASHGGAAVVTWSLIIAQM